MASPPWRVHARTWPGPPSAGSPPIVLVHGLVVSSRSVAPAGAALARLARLAPVAAPDLPGFGRTAGPARALGVTGLSDALAGWLVASGNAPAVLVANSFGCQVVVDLAARRPGLASALVLVGPTVDPAARSAWRQAARWVADWPFERPSLAAVVARDLVAAGVRRAAATFAAALADAPEAKLPAVPVPVLVVRGERDTVAPARWVAEAAALAPLGRVATVPGAGHTLVHGAPEPLADLVAAFLRDAGLGGSTAGREPAPPWAGGAGVAGDGVADGGPGEPGTGGPG